MKWEYPVMYYGDETKLCIKTFEMAELTPEVKIKLQHHETQEEKGVFEESFVIDKDESELAVELELDENMMEELLEKEQLEFTVSVTSETILFKICECERLILMKRTLQI
jgi:hypothetical protein